MSLIWKWQLIRDFQVTIAVPCTKFRKLSIVNENAYFLNPMSIELIDNSAMFLEFLSGGVNGEHMNNRYLWLATFLMVLTWSAINPKDYYTWFLEVSPALLGLFILIVTYKSYRLTAMVYQLILVHCIILMVGGHYTYAEVPFFDGLLNFMNSGRNNYDKLGHLAQGFVPVMIAREISIRNNIFKSGVWRNFFIICFVLALSAFYELIEWWVALMSDEAAESFLGTQGYAWDTQSDMFMALLGALFALMVLSKHHDRQLSNIN